MAHRIAVLSLLFLALWFVVKRSILLIQRIALFLSLTRIKIITV